MAKNLIGRFYFKLTDSKNLIGEFSNNRCNRNSPECGDRISSNTDDGTFVGEYHHIWYDDVSRKPGAVVYRLKIEHKSECKDIFTLTWRFMPDGVTPNSTPTFWGEGILCDGMLIGDYRNFPTP